MRMIKQNLGAIIACVIEVSIGVLLLLNPVGFTSVIIIALGIVFLLAGIVSMIRYFRTDAEQACMEQHFVKGLLGVMLGLFCCLNSEWFILTFPVLTIIYGVANLISGLFKAQFAVDAMRLKKRWGWAAFSAVVTILFAVTILLNPFTSSIVLWEFTAIALIIEAVCDLLSTIFGNRRKKSSMQTDENILD